MVSGRVAGAVAAAVLAAAGASGQAVAVPTGPGTRPEPPRPAADREAVGAPAHGPLPSSYLRPAAPPARPALRPLPRPAAGTSVRPAVQGVRAGTAPADTEPVAPVVPLTESAPAAPGEHGAYQLLLGSRFSTVPKALVPAADLPKALTYKPSLVPAGAGVRVEQRTDGAGTRVTLRVTGLKAGHHYGAHVHTGVCGADPAAAGGHYQHRADPRRPSTGPAYANPRNEVWLDFTADALGDGTATATHPWGFRPGGARSIVLHEAAGASERAACVSVPFGGR
ncbi:superoxide dismutase family protein [Streptomyces sp. NPDC047046]|uniref:superoxide dismutase family protein n=1 Tax=Streptomyces sp. NPDC047046 TaxID=3155378 RepID=UPI0033C188B7